MEKTRKCKGCGATLKADYRNKDRQSFCARKACQKLRRARGQRIRRQQQRAAKPTSKAQIGTPKPARRPQEASLVSPPDIRAENPVIIGLISMITGSIDLEEIAATHRQLWIRGQQILEGAQLPNAGNSQPISVFQELQERSTREA